MIKITIKMFGVFQDYFSDDVCVDVLNGTSIFLLKKELVEKFRGSSFVNFEYILDKSVFSNDSNILADDYILMNNDIIYLLPPFSGG